MKTTLIIILSLLIIATTGGSYYYYWVYQPKQYAEQIVAVYTKLEAAGLKPDTSTLKDKNDYQAAIKVLDERVGLLTRTQTDLAAIKPPKSFAHIHADMTDFVAFLLKQHREAQGMVVFFSKAHDLLTQFEATKEVFSMPQKNNIVTAGDLQKFWEKHIAEIKVTGKELFAAEVAGLKEPSFLELKSSWEKALPAADVLLDIVRSFNPKLPIEQAGNALSAAQQKKFQKNMEDVGPHVEKFYKLLNAALDKESAYDILAFRFSPIPQTDMSEQIFKISNIIQDLKNMYLR